LNVPTIGQRMAQAASDRIRERKPDEPYRSFAREFPMLVHSCGLAQALAFARAEGEHHKKYAEDLAKVLAAAGHEQVGSAEQLARRIRDVLWVTQYIRLSRDALAAAVWLKRSVEAAGEGPAPSQGV
jgi:CRISPR-associated protein Cmr5